MLDVRWDIMFEELRKFKDKEGHSNVPYNFSDNPELARWVSKQRERRSKISQERASRLDSIGFNWGFRLDVRWEIMFEELRKFKDKEGHCDVPRNYSVNQELGTWVSNQRQRRWRISEERASKLDSIGFNWSIRLDYRWEIMFEELRKFKDKEGHCNVPQVYSESP